MMILDVIASWAEAYLYIMQLLIFSRSTPAC